MAKVRSNVFGLPLRCSIPLPCSLKFGLAENRFTEVDQVVRQGAPQRHAFDFIETSYGQRRQSAIGSQLSVYGLAGGRPLLVDLLAFFAVHPLFPCPDRVRIAWFGCELVTSVAWVSGRFGRHE